MGSLNEVKCCFILKARSGFGESPILVTDIGQNLALRVRLLSIIVVFERVVDRALHSLLQVNISWAQDMISLIL